MKFVELLSVLLQNNLKKELVFSQSLICFNDLDCFCTKKQEKTIFFT
jgi:hypothetical protein